MDISSATLGGRQRKTHHGRQQRFIGVRTENMASSTKEARLYQHRKPKDCNWSACIKSLLVGSYLAGERMGFRCRSDARA